LRKNWIYQKYRPCIESTLGISNTRGFQISSIDSSSSTLRRVRFEYRVVSLYENQDTEKSSFKAGFFEFHMFFLIFFEYVESLQRSFDLKNSFFWILRKKKIALAL
jgi:hypothetical protein